MTLDEAIFHAEEVAEEHTKYNRYGGLESWDKCAEEHRQLAGWLKDYKRLLEQEPCTDAVSREVVKERMIKYGFHSPDMTVTEFVEDLPLVTPVACIAEVTLDKDELQKIVDERLKELELAQDWIPVSERLPKIADVYRVTRHYPNNVMNPQYLVDACFFDGSNTWYNDNRINHERTYVTNVIAWQENPKPYKAEMESGE